jgi:hypothetical protein
MIDKLSFEITSIDLLPNKWGKNDLIITKVKVLDENGKFIKFAKLNQELLKALKEKGTVSIRKI